MVVATTLLLIALLGGQAAADALAQHDGGLETGRAVGRAGFAYLSGLRTAVAAMLWNRLEPQLHTYYLGVPLEDQTYILPTISLVITLDPQFEQAYYVAPWVIARRGDAEEGLELARLGTLNIPESALLQASYAQMIAVFEEDYARAAQEADKVLDLSWESIFEQHDWFGVLRSIYKNAGRQDMVDRLSRELERIDAEIAQTDVDVEHDHDADGVPDH